MAMATIIAADQYHLPVSTTHVLSSGIAGTMAANRSGLQTGTLRNLLLAWVLTLPVSVLLGALTFAGGLYIVLHSLVVHTLAVVGIAILITGFILLRKLGATRAESKLAA
jgi:PiT family inorganic phosphate transporter